MNQQCAIFRSRSSNECSLNVLGDSQAILLSAEDTGGAFALIDQENPPGFEVPLNLHEIHDETNFLISGQITFVVGSSTLELCPGDCLHIQRGTPHRFKVTGSQPARMLLTFHPAGLENLFRELHSRFPVGKVIDLAELNRVCAPYRTRVLEF